MLSNAFVKSMNMPSVVYNMYMHYSFSFIKIRQFAANIAQLHIKYKTPAYIFMNTFEENYSPHAPLLQQYIRRAALKSEQDSHRMRHTWILAKNF